MVIDMTKMKVDTILRLIDLMEAVRSGKPIYHDRGGQWAEVTNLEAFYRDILRWGVVDGEKIHKSIS